MKYVIKVDDESSKEIYVFFENLFGFFIDKWIIFVGGFVLYSDVVFGSSVYYF